jgi:DTW domain-containing protein YfiP
MKFWLLTHTEELKKTTGTGKLIKETLGDDCDIIVWSRVLPCEAILNLSPDNTLLIYPHENDQNTNIFDTLQNIENIIIIDGTWQQARKIYNQSPYLKVFPHKEIQGVKSIYSKRRNQKNIGLCTAEVAIHLLNEQKHPSAQDLLDNFLEFNQ